MTQRHQPLAEAYSPQQHVTARRRRDIKSSPPRDATIDDIFFSILFSRIIIERLLRGRWYAAIDIDEWHAAVSAFRAAQFPQRNAECSRASISLNA